MELDNTRRALANSLLAQIEAAVHQYQYVHKLTQTIDKILKTYPHMRNYPSTTATKIQKLVTSIDPAAAPHAYEDYFTEDGSITGVHLHAYNLLPHPCQDPLYQKLASTFNKLREHIVQHYPRFPDDSVTRGHIQDLTQNVRLIEEAEAFSDQHIHSYRSPDRTRKRLTKRIESLRKIASRIS